MSDANTLNSRHAAWKLAGTNNAASAITSALVHVCVVAVLLPAVQQLEIEVHKLAGSDEHPLWRL
jgi:hypothetical protein